MSVLRVTGIVVLSTGTLMAIIYAVVLAHVYRGNKNPWLMIVVSIMLLSQIFLVTWGVVWMLEHVNHVYSPLIFTLHGLSVGLYYLFFNLGHFMIAYRYGTIAKVVPQQLTGN